jgi:signal peptidase II
VLAFLVAAITIAADQVSKMVVLHRVPFCERVPFLGNFCRITNIRNSGAVFGVMRGSGTYFTVFSVVAAGALAVAIMLSRKSSTLVKVSLGLVLGGALGNLIDRFRFGAVVDFIDIGFSRSVRWPSFNVADAAITVGVVLLIANALKMTGHETRNEGDNVEGRDGDHGEDRQVPERG